MSTTLTPLDVAHLYVLIGRHEDALDFSELRLKARIEIADFFRAHDAELRARIDELEKDAARYRWLRKGFGFQMSVPNGVSDSGKPRHTHYTFGHKPESEYGATLDTVVKAAVHADEQK